MSVSDEQGVNDELENESALVEGDAPEVDEEEISIGQPEAPTGESEEEEEATPVIRKMREELKAKSKRERDLERQLREIEAQKQTKPTDIAPDVLPEKRLADFDYDEDALAAHYAARADSLVKHQQYIARQAQKQEDDKSAYQAKFNAYTAQKDELKVPKDRMAEAEEAVVNALDQAKQNLILQTGIPARLVYAIGNSSEHLAKLASIKDRDEFNRELGRIEGQLVVTKRKAVAPSPEKRLGGGGGASRSANALDKLREEAAITGDMSKVMAYKRQHKS